MSWRTVIISNRSKLDLKLNALVIRQEEGITRILLSEIYMLIIESTAVSLTAALLSELVNRKINVIFCDEKRNPSSQIFPLYGSHDTSDKIRRQIKWSVGVKTLIWTEILTEKIRKQCKFLKDLEKEEYKLLEQYLTEIVPNDYNSREGHAAKVYFNALFGKSFTRSTENNINAALNYGYSIILSAINREIVSNGYITQLGIFHDNQFNKFNLGCDLMEPFRILVDRKVYSMNLEKFGKEEKAYLGSIFDDEIIIKSRKYFVANGLKIYIKSVFDAIEERDISLINFYRHEL